MQPVLNTIADLAIWFFVITSMAAMGLQLTAREIVAPLKRKWLLFVSLLANFVINPFVCCLRDLGHPG